MNEVEVNAAVPGFAELKAWATLGTLVAPLLHELGNELNTVGLQTRILQRKLPADQYSLLDVTTRGLGNCKNLLEWMRRMREPLDKTRGTIDAAAFLRGELRVLSEAAKPVGESQTPTVQLVAPAKCAVEVQSPFEFCRMLQLRLRDAIVSAQTNTMDLIVGVRMLDRGIEIQYRPTPRSDAAELGERFQVSMPLEPLAELERIQCDSIAGRIGVVVNGGLTATETGLTLST